MKIFRSLDEVPGGFGPSVVTIGNFDGVHCGHRSVIRQVVQRARERGAQAVLVTLDPHPRSVLRPEQPVRLITSLERKLALLSTTELDAVVLLPFTETLSRMSAPDFCMAVLQRGLGAIEIHEGADFRFGYRGEADMQALSALGRQYGFSTEVFAPLYMRGEAVSSSRIRSLVSSGDVSTARHLLGRPFAVDSTPARGRGFGTRYAVPTINLAETPLLLPGNGVYTTELQVGAGEDALHFEGVTNVGNRPTFGEDSFAVETFLFRFSPIDLQEDTPLRLTFLKRLREERRWPSPEALKAQIGRDVATAERWFSLRRLLQQTAPSSLLRENARA